MHPGFIISPFYPFSSPHLHENDLRSLSNNPIRFIHPHTILCHGPHNSDLNEVTASNTLICSRTEGWEIMISYAKETEKQKQSQETYIRMLKQWEERNLLTDITLVKVVVNQTPTLALTSLAKRTTKINLTYQILCPKPACNENNYTSWSGLALSELTYVYRHFNLK